VNVVCEPTVSAGESGEWLARICAVKPGVVESTVIVFSFTAWPASRTRPSPCLSPPNSGDA
jgi:hypothetical protein